MLATRSHQVDVHSKVGAAVLPAKIDFASNTWFKSLLGHILTDILAESRSTIKSYILGLIK